MLLPCYKLHRIVLTPAGHPLLKTKRLTLEKLAAYPLITYDYAFIGRSKTLGAFEARGIEPNIVLNAIDADVIKTYVEFGLGIAIVPDMAYDRARDKKPARDRREPSLRAQHDTHRHPAQSLPARLHVCVHRDVRAASEARGRRESDRGVGDAASKRGGGSRKCGA